MIEVVSAILIVRFADKQNRILLTQRKADQPFPFTWCSPGGKVRSGEEPTRALARELFEEIGAFVTMDCFSEVTSVAVRVPPNDEAVVKFFVPVGGLMPGKDGTIYTAAVPREGQGIGWFTSGEMVTLPLVPGNRKALAKIVELLRVRA